MSGIRTIIIWASGLGIVAFLGWALCFYLESDHGRPWFFNCQVQNREGIGRHWLAEPLMDGQDNYAIVDLERNVCVVALTHHTRGIGIDMPYTMGNRVKLFVGDNNFDLEMPSNQFLLVDKDGIIEIISLKPGEAASIYHTIAHCMSALEIVVEDYLRSIPAGRLLMKRESAATRSATGT